jgi:hypothetical protein
LLAPIWTEFTAAATFSWWAWLILHPALKDWPIRWAYRRLSIIANFWTP